MSKKIAEVSAVSEATAETVDDVLIEQLAHINGVCNRLCDELVGQLFRQYQERKRELGD